MKTLLALFSYGGVAEGTVDAVLSELAYCSSKQQPIMYHRMSGDALIERSRSRALGRFMASDADVMVMVDHDISWRAGDAFHIAQQAHEKSALVGGLYCKRAMKKGWASRVPATGNVQFGVPGLIETPSLATGFLAVPRVVVQGVLSKLDITKETWQKNYKEAVEAKDEGRISELVDLSIAPIADGAYRTIDFEYHDYFRCIRYRSARPNIYQFLSEDWSFSLRVVYCGFKSFLSTYPMLVHTGDYGYTVQDGMDDADRGLAPNGTQQDNGTVNNPNPQPGGNPGNVRNECNASRRDRPVPFRTHGKTRRRRRR